jgi:hypothetical protein
MRIDTADGGKETQGLNTCDFESGRAYQGGTDASRDYKDRLHYSDFEYIADLAQEAHVD